MNEQKIDSQEESSEDEVVGIQVGNKEIFSTDKTVRLVKYVPEIYGGINMPDETSMVIQFPLSGPVMLGVEADQGVGKTSFMRCAMELLGGDIAKNGINTLAKKKSASITLQDTRNGVNYVAKIGTKSFSLSRIEDLGGTKQTMEIKSPKDFLRKLIGPLGTNPMELSEMKSAEQIKWVRDLFPLTQDNLEEETRILKGIKDASDNRKKTARELTRVRADLTSAGYAKYAALAKTLTPTKQYEDQKKYYSQEIDERQQVVTAKFEEVNTLRNEKQIEQRSLDSLNESRSSVGREMAELEERLKTLKNRHEQLGIQISESTEKMSKFDDVEAKYDAAQTAMNEMTKYISGRTNIEKVDNAFLEYDQYDEKWKAYQSELDEYTALHKKFVKLFTPDIEGIEVCVPSQIDIAAEKELFLTNYPEATEKEIEDHIMSLSAETREGIFYNGHAMSELSESEVWEVAMLFWSLMGVNVAFIENVQSLGSKAKERIEWLAARGCTIFFSAMKRDEKTLKAEFYDAIPE